MSRSKGFAQVYILFAVLILVILGVAYSSGKFPLNSPSQPQISPTPTPAADETANWKTYRNEKYKYQFNYPTNWYIQTLGDAEVYISDQKLDIKNGMDSPSLQYDLISIYHAPANQIDMKVTAPVGTRQKLSQFIYMQKIADLKIGGRPGAKIVYVDQQHSSESQPETAYLVSLNDGTLDISATSSAKLKMIDKILPTFKFN